MRELAVEVTRHPANQKYASGLGHGGARANELKPGDYILVHSHGKLAPRLIGFGQKLHYDPAYAYWTHAAVFAENDSKGGLLIEAKGGQHTRYVALSQYDVRDYAAVRYKFGPDGEEKLWQTVSKSETTMRQNAVEFARRQVGRDYNYFMIGTLSMWALFGGKLTVGLSGTNVCSGLVAQATMYMGEIYDGDPVTVMPADLAKMHDIRR